MRLSRSASPRSVLFSLLALGACDFSIDPGHVLHDAGGDACDEECDVDWQAPGHGDGGLHDAGADVGSYVDTDAGSVAFDAGSSCLNSNPCAAGEFCATDGQCEPDCYGDRGCVGPAIERMNVQSVISAGDRMIWSTLSSKDDLGYPVADGAIWLWSGKGEPVRIAQELTDALMLVALIDGYVYYKPTFDGPLHRVLLQPGSVPERLRWQMGDVATVWSTETKLYWTAFVGEQEQLWTRPRTGGADQQLLTRERVDSGAASPGFDWSAGNDQLAFSAEFGAAYAHPLSGAAPYALEDVGSSEIPNVLPVGSRYLVYALDVVGRTDLDVNESRVIAQPGDAFAPGYTRPQVEARGSWVYWIGSGTTRTQKEQNLGLTFGRAHLEFPSQRAELAEASRPITYEESEQSLDFKFPPMFVNARGDVITYYHPHYKRLFTLEVDPLPCSGTLACPDGLTCVAGNCD